MITEKQVWARRRNWLIMRLKGAKSIFSYDNVEFMDGATKENSFLIAECEEAIDDLLKALRKSYIGKRNKE